MDSLEIPKEFLGTEKPRVFLGFGILKSSKGTFCTENLKDFHVPKTENIYPHIRALKKNLKFLGPENSKEFSRVHSFLFLL